MGSLIAGGFLMFLMLVVFQGRIRVRGASFCHHVDGVVVLGDVPCFVVNVFAALAILALFLAIVVAAIAGGRKLSS